MIIYGPNFTMESMSETSSINTISKSGRIGERQDMAGTKLIDLSKDISYKMFWIGGGIYQPIFEFTETGQHQQNIIDTCFIYAKRIKGRNTS